ncbi:MULTISPECIES: hypothetical protein [unclassified Moorena]|uniref:hypothetical protein n=1 Tax=unclassified Moorena TaxID=2683338 RepID=UPI001400909A|nr:MULTISPECIES: hypothetical protein [unclassified Moorena]NEO11792.1 hypothetical protein [Moorena sp. SIO3E8]NEO46969.1 hypothetical protein [Moorena sp. SIO4A3]NEP98307.1 hypothetical protein [Moorena sp. SIO3F7]
MSDCNGRSELACYGDPVDSLHVGAGSLLVDYFLLNTQLSCLLQLIGLAVGRLVTFLIKPTLTATD